LSSENAVDRRRMTCYPAVYAVFNVAYAVGMVAADAVAPTAVTRLGFVPGVRVIAVEPMYLTLQSATAGDLPAYGDQLELVAAPGGAARRQNGSRRCGSMARPMIHARPQSARHAAPRPT
jgi:hypothetical protein